MKFSIRDLLLVTVIVALAVGWWVDRSRLASESQKEKRAHWDELKGIEKQMEKDIERLTGRPPFH